jgi:hypothetical protein
MADFVFNIAKGRVAELYNRVDSNDAANSVLVVIPVDVAAVTDATIKDLDTFAAITGGTDANLVPLTQHDFAITPDGSDVTAVINAAGFFRAT